jgi:glycosyltransferase involved in cell wall biosynthesis
MKIAYLARRPIPSVHAHTVQIVKMCEAFGRLGHEVILFANRGDDDPISIYGRYGATEAFGIEVYQKRPKHLKKPRFVAWLLRNAFVRQADLFFGRDITSLAAVTPFGKPVIYEAHAIPAMGSFRWRLLSWLFARKNFSHLVCVTSTLAELHRQQFPALANKRIIVAPNAAAQAPSAEGDMRWPGRPDTVQIGFVGRPFPGKGVEMLVDAARQLPGLDFHIVGATDADIPWIQMAIPSNLYFHGYQPHGRLGGYLEKFDIAAAPYGSKVMNASRTESAAITSPLKFLEYMAAGLPSIISDLPGVRDILGDESGEVCQLIPPGDDRAFVAALARLAGDIGLRQRMGRAARQTYLERHTVDARAKRVLGHFA